MKIFLSYAHEDERYKEKLQVSLAVLKNKGLIEVWDDRQLMGGQEWDATIKKALDDADIVLLLVSPDFLASSYIFDVEVKLAMEEHRAKTVRVIPIIVRPCLWKETEFVQLQAFPKNAKPISSWNDEDEAFFDIAKNIEEIVSPGESTAGASNTDTNNTSTPPSQGTNDLLTEAIDLVEVGETNSALAKVESYFILHSLRKDNQYILLSSRQSRLRDKITSGTITPENQDIDQNRINLDLLTFIQNLQDS